MTEEEKKFCKDCKFCVSYSMHFADVGAQCSRATYIRTDLVTGHKATVGYTMCYDERSIGCCGSFAEYFEPKEKSKSTITRIKEWFTFSLQTR